MPNTIDEGYSITVSSRSLRMAIVVLWFLAAASLVFCSALTYRWKQGYIVRINSLENGIVLREAKFERLSEEFGATLVLEDKLRTIAGLAPRQDTGGQEAGMGGQENMESPDPGDARQNMGGPSPYPSFSYDAKKTDTDTFMLAMLAARDSFSEILGVFEKEQDRLLSIPSINPVYSPDAWISSGYGYRKDPINGARRFHDGIDIVAQRKTPIIAPAKGVVTCAGWQSGLGRVVKIKHGYGYSTLFGHNDKLLVKKGDTVERGDTIALLGNSGRSTGPHVHYEIRKDDKAINPYHYVIE